MDSRVLGLINGPNLNLLGVRKPELYGGDTLDTIVGRLKLRAGDRGYDLAHVQSNHEGALIDAIQLARTNWAGLIINPAAYSHTSIGIRDALEMLTIPVIEVHLSNIHARESFRSHSMISPVVRGVICGLGPIGYSVAMEALFGLLEAT
jgi:3-dehydroquinate dehydratase-2